MNKTRLDQWISKTEGLTNLTRERLEALQLQRLNETLSRVKSRGGIYRDLPDSVSELKELADLPFTTPEMLSTAPGRFLLTSQSDITRVISGATSGTTGPAKRVFYTQQDTNHTVGFFAAGIGEMVAPGEKCLIAFPFSGPFGLGDLIAKAVEQTGGIPIKAGFGQTWQELMALVRNNQPETYIGFPVTLLSLARMYGTNFPIRRALVSGDACPPGIMTELENLLGSKLYPHYGSRECGLGGAVTCPAFEGMHLRENHIIPEIVDPLGNVLPDGEYGELVLTTIGMEAMPLIRYRTGDYTRILPPCPCGGVTKRIDRVSRKEGPFSIETLDSSLFQIPELVDYHIAFDGTLRVLASVLPGMDWKKILSFIECTYPGISCTLECEYADPSHRPMYLGKRFVDFHSPTPDPES